MFKHSRWILAGLLILTLSLLSCKLISVDQQAVTVVVTIEQTFNVHPPNQTSNSTTINTADYWPEGFDGWSILNSNLTDLQFAVSGVSTQERSVSASFKVDFNVLPSGAVQELGTTDQMTLGEILDTPMTVWNDKVNINTAGKNALLSAVSGKKTINLTGTTQNASGDAEFACIATIKVQLTLQKD
jgi:hypothetical protein